MCHLNKETGESNPDFDKIVPLCDLYNISTDELIRGESNSNVEKNIEKENSELKEENIEEPKKEIISYKPIKRFEPLVVSISIFLYFISVVWIIMIESLDVISDEMMISIFLVIAAIPTCILTYYYMSVGNKKRYLKEQAKYNKNIELIEDKDSRKYKEIDDILALLFTIIFLYVSFVTGGWYITWILWLVYSLVIRIVHLVLDAKEGNK